MMNKNLNKLFPRLNISRKLVIAFLGVGVLPLVVYGVYSVWSMSNSLEEQALKTLQFQIDQTGEEIGHFLERVEYDLQYLKSLRSVRQFASLQTVGSKHPGVDIVRTRNEMQQDFLKFSQGKHSYYQLRYLDASGMEVIRVNRTGDSLFVTSGEDLQNKSGRYYFLEGMATAHDSIYVSSMDLNIERGIVEVPLRPVFRYGTPVTDGDGVKRGLLIINIFAEAIFDIMGGVPEESVSYLTNKQGLYLYQSFHTTGFDYFRNRSLHDDYPANVVQAVLSSSSGLTHTPERILAHASICGSMGSAQSWVLLMVVPKKVVLASVIRLKTVFLGLLLLIAAAVCFLAMLAARQFVRPILKLTHGADLIARGNFERRIKIETNDELEDLSGHFNTMARRLGKTRAKLKSWNEELQNEVVRRTTALTISEARLRIEKQKLDDIVSSIGAELCLIDQDLSVIWVNKILAERCNGQGFVLGEARHKLFNDESANLLENQNGAAFSGQMSRDVVVSRADADGRERIYQVVSTPVVDLNGEANQRLEMHLDITDSVLKERALEKQSAEKKSLASQVQMAAGVIHEVAKPLAAMKTTVQVLEGEMIDAENKSYFVEIENKIDHLREFLQTFSKYARPRPLTRELCKMVDAVKHVLLLVEKDAERRSVKIFARNLETLPEIMLDSIQLQQALLNICVNAFEALPDGGTITLTGSEADTPVAGQQLVICDTGTGIEEDKIPHIFEPFFSDKPNGSGLGLAIAQQIIREHGGEIHVKSSYGQGTEFLIFLPA